MVRPSSQLPRDLQFVLGHNASLFERAADQQSKLGALIVYLNDLSEMLRPLLGNDAPQMLAPMSVLAVELDRLLAKQGSALLKVSNRGGTPLSAKDRELRLHAIVAVRLYQRCGLTRSAGQERVSRLLNERGFKSRKRDEDGNREMTAKLVGKWVDQATPMGKMADIAAYVAKMLGNGFPERISEREADTAVALLIGGLPDPQPIDP